LNQQGRQYQVTVFLIRSTLTKQFKSKKEGETWAKQQKGYVSHHIETVK
jgi:hypothetical protein